MWNIIFFLKKLKISKIIFHLSICTNISFYYFWCVLLILFLFEIVLIFLNYVIVSYIFLFFFSCTNKLFKFHILKKKKKRKNSLSFKYIIQNSQSLKRDYHDNQNLSQNCLILLKLLTSTYKYIAKIVLWYKFKF